VPAAPAAVAPAPSANAPYQQQRGPAPTASTAAAPNNNPLRVEDALQYLERVKSTFDHKPKVYNDFLDIMKDFKNKTIDTPGVIRRVSTLFRGHTQLILQFNTFLPQGYKISEADLSDPTNPAYCPPSPTATQQQPQRIVPQVAPQPHYQQQQPTQQQWRQQQPAQPRMQPMQQPVQQPMQQPRASTQARQPSRPPEKKQQIDFNQAIQFVNKIKARFTEDAEVYKRFLEILQTYSKDNRNQSFGIKEVYEQVAELFKDQPDLLSEFTHFLPDQTGQATMPGLPRSRQPAKGKPKPNAQAERRKQAAARRKGKKQQEQLPELNPKELEFFATIKRQLQNDELYHEILKCMNLYTEDLITRSEMMTLLEELFGRHHMTLFMEFREFLSDIVGDELSPRDKMTREERMAQWKNKPISEIPDEMCEQLGQSYRKLPKLFENPKCEGRAGDEICEKTLNDVWVSVPTGSEGALGDVNFKHVSRNKYEETLFKCEDERYELDMLIEANSAVILELEELSLVIDKMSSDEKLKFHLAEQRLSATQKRSIERVYGPDFDAVILQNVFKYPAVAVPIVLTRLKQKNEEWIRLRVDYNREWQKTMANNFYRSLDHRSFYFKQSDKKTISSKVLVAEMAELPAGVSWVGEFSLSAAVAEDALSIVQFALETEYADEYEIQECIVFWKEITSVFFTIEGAGLDAAADDLDGMSVAEDSFESGTDWSDEDPPTHAQADSESAAAEDETDLFLAAQNAAASIPHEPVAAMDSAAFALRGSTPFSASEAKSLASRVDLHKLQGRGKVIAAGDRNAALEAELAATSNASESEPAGTDRMRFACDLAAARATSMQFARPETSGSGASVLYANESLYVYVRLHQLLYKRLALARDCARRKDEGSKKPVTGVMQQLSALAGSALSGDSEEGSASPTQDSHGSFFNLLCQLINNTTDATTYEDQTRELLGTSAYELFTLDKVIARLVRQLYTVAVDKHVCRRLLKLKALHQVRREASGERWAPYVLDTQYRETVCELLDNERDSTCYRLELSASSELEETGTLSVRVVLDPDDAPRAPDGDEVVGAEGFIHRILDPVPAQMLSGPPTGGGASVFLSRNVRATTAKASRGARLQAACVVNGLEMVASIDGASSGSDSDDDDDDDSSSVPVEPPKPKRQKQRFDDLPPSKRRRRTNFGDVSRRMVYMADTEDFLHLQRR
jgi:histone deacetylase complex regulatory component SIN3